MFIRILFYTLNGTAVLWLADQFVLDMSFTGSFKIMIFCGFVLGLLNTFLKPILKKITFPLRLLTFGLFSFVINMIILELVDILFPELIISGVRPLFLISLILGVTSTALAPLIKKIS